MYGGISDMRTQPEAFLQLVEEFCLIQSIDISTRGDNIFDVVMTKNEQLLYDYTVNKTNLSDHIITVTVTITSKV